MRDTAFLREEVSEGRAAGNPAPRNQMHGDGAIPPYVRGAVVPRSTISATSYEETNEADLSKVKTERGTASDRATVFCAHSSREVWTAPMEFKIILIKVSRRRS